MAIFLGGLILSSCSERTGELIGAQNRPVWYGYDPFGMNYIPAGSYNMGQSDQDAPFVHQTRSKRFLYLRSILILLKLVIMNTVNL